MIKKIFLFLVCSIFSLHMISCTSSHSEDADEMTTADSASTSQDGLEDVDAPADASAQQEGAAPDATATAETLPDDALSNSASNDLSLEEPAAPTQADADSLATPDPAATDQAPIPDAVASTTDTPPSDATMTDPNSTLSADAAPPIDTTSEKSIATSGTTSSFSGSGGSLQKVALTPWKVDGILFNAVYFAKPGDTLKSISKTIYASDKTKDLKKGNPMFKSRSVKSGDKVYYTSISRPQDDTRVLTYYEDQGMQPLVYTSKKGDTVKSVSKELFGYRDGWKELYSMNSFESKGSLPEGTEIRYFPYSKMSGGNMTAPPVVDMSPPPVQMTPPPATLPSAPPVEMAPPPPSTTAAAELPPPPPPPPAETPQEMAPPPPPPPAAEEHPRKKQHEAPAEVAEAPPIWEDTSILLGAGCLALIGIGGIFIVRSRKKKQAELDAALNQQVGT